MPVTTETKREVTIKPSGHMEIKEHTVYIDGDSRVAGPAHRRIIAPDVDVSAEDDEVKGYAAVAHTPERVAAARGRRSPR